MNKIKQLLFSLGKEITLKTNAGNQILVKKRVINGRNFGEVLNQGESSFLIDERTLALLFKIK